MMNCHSFPSGPCKCTCLVWTWWVGASDYEFANVRTCSWLCILRNLGLGVKMVAIFLLPLAHVQGVKVIDLVFVIVVVSTKITIYRDLGTWATRTHLELIEFGEKLASICLNRETRSTSVRNIAFFLAIIATPMNNSMHNAYGHVLSAHVHNYMYM